VASILACRHPRYAPSQIADAADSTARLVTGARARVNTEPVRGQSWAAQYAADQLLGPARSRRRSLMPRRARSSSFGVVRPRLGARDSDRVPAMQVARGSQLVRVANGCATEMVGLGID